MTVIYYTEMKHLFTEKEMNMINRFYNSEMKQRIGKSHSHLFRDRRITFMCMMFKICRLLKIPFQLLRQIYHNDYGKLIMKNYTIGVSYSGKYVFCLLSNLKVGFDVEKINSNISENEFKIFNHFFKSDIRDRLTFFKEWTRLESLVKYFDNKGIKDFLNNKLHRYENKLETIHMIFDNSYMIAISFAKLSPIKEKIQFKQI